MIPEIVEPRPHRPCLAARREDARSDEPMRVRRPGSTASPGLPRARARRARPCIRRCLQRRAARSTGRTEPLRTRSTGAIATESSTDMEWRSSGTASMQTTCFSFDASMRLERGKSIVRLDRSQPQLLHPLAVLGARHDSDRAPVTPVHDPRGECGRSNSGRWHPAARRPRRSSSGRRCRGKAGPRRRRRRNRAAGR